MAKGKKEFAREVKKLGSIKHPNLVSINGYYWGPRDHEKLVISTFINAQSLAFYLQGKIKSIGFYIDGISSKVRILVINCGLVH